MTLALNPAFFGNGRLVPLAGLRKPPCTSRITRLVWPTYDRATDVRYRIEHWMQNRCCNVVQVGSITLCVVDDYGNLVAVEDGGARMVMKRIYIAGPMSGLPDFNYPAFQTAAAVLRAQGHHVENPTENPPPACGSWQGYMRMSLRQIAACDCLYMLPG